MNPRPRNRRLAKMAKYTVPVGEHTPGAEKRLNRRGQLKRGFKYTDGGNTSGRIPLSTVAVPKRHKRRTRVVGGVTPSGRGTTKYIK